MNFLAHFFLSEDDEALSVGNFLADFISKREADSLPESIQRGIRLHRLIDQYTDEHPLVRQGISRLHAHHRKYARVVLDVFYDFFLIHNWPQYSVESLDDFTARIYGMLLRQKGNMPNSVQDRLPAMVNANWLQGYGHEEGLAYTFFRMSRRVSQPAHLENVLETLRLYEAEMNAEFNAFFPDVVQEAVVWKATLE